MRFRTLWIAAAMLCACVCFGWLANRIQHPSPVTEKVRTQKIEPPKLSFDLQAIIDLTRTAARPKQIGEHLHNLGKQMTPVDQNALCLWMRQPKPGYLPGPAWQWLVNEAMDKLCQQEIPTSSLTGVLIATYQDLSSDFVLRDYAIQHLAHYLQPSSVWEPCERDSQRRKQIATVLLQAVERADESIAGTALQGMNLALFAREQICTKAKVPEVLPLDVLDGKQLEAVALALLQAKEHNLLATITALQICAQRRCESALPIARRIADDSSERTALRVSAISVLGQLGVSDDEPTLKRLSLDKDARIAHAADSALHRSRFQPAV